MASTLGYIFECNPPEIAVHDFSLTTGKGQNWKFGQQNLAYALASIVLKFEITKEKQFEFELQRSPIFGKNTVVPIIIRTRKNQTIYYRIVGTIRSQICVIAKKLTVETISLEHAKQNDEILDS